MPLDATNYLLTQKPDAYNPYAAGAKRYGMGATGPNIGPMSAEGSSGYMERDAMARAKKAAMMNLLEKQKRGLV
jgi:hypothetical protein